MRGVVCCVGALILAIPAFAASISGWKPDGLEIIIDGSNAKPKSVDSPFFITDATPTEAQALLRAIDKFPDEDTPRLAYADYLDEHGQGKAAEFIRLQCEVARVPRLPGFRDKRNRSLALLKENGKKWFSPLENRVQRICFELDLKNASVYLTIRRGFPWGSGVSLDAGDLSNEEQHRRFSSAYATLANNVVAPLVPRARELALLGQKEQNLPYVLRDVLMLSAYSEASALSMDSSYASVLGNAKLRTLVTWGLKDFTFDTVTDPGLNGIAPIVRGLTAHPEYADLRALRIAASEREGPTEPSPDNLECIERFVSRDWPSLERLELPALGLDRTSLAPLLAIKRFPSLRALNLASNLLNDEAVRGLFRTEFPKLADLDISGNPFTSRGLQELKSSPFVKQLGYLDAHKTSSDPPFGDRVNSGRSRSHRGTRCDALVETIAAIYL